ncbi:MAG: hypothetical protein ABI414_16235 [Devosia sp.]
MLSTIEYIKRFFRRLAFPVVPMAETSFVPKAIEKYLNGGFDQPNGQTDNDVHNVRMGAAETARFINRWAGMSVPADHRRRRIWAGLLLERNIV